MAMAGTARAEEQAPAARESRKWRALARTARQNPLGVAGFLIVAGFIFLGVFGPYLAPHDPRGIDVTAQLQGASLAHPFGTNSLGQDMLSRVIAGARISLLIGLATVGIGVAGGAVLGVVSGYSGGIVDSAIQRLSEAGAAFPGLLFYMVLIAAIGRGVETIVIGVAVFAVIGGSRVLRSLTVMMRDSPFTEAARAAGATELRILVTHIVPNVIPIIIVVASGAFGAAVLAEAALSFLGIGLEPGTPSWGVDLSGENLTFAANGKWHLVAFPGGALSLVVLGFNLLGDTMRDILDPRLRGGLR
jgi:ABC-type dipeptide/oligopeptide/nickel transport system permease subunit